MSKREKCAFVCVCAFEKRFWCAGEKGRYPGACRIDRSQRPPFDRMTTPDRSCATLSIISVCVCVYRVYTNVCGVCVCVSTTTRYCGEYSRSERAETQGGREQPERADRKEGTRSETGKEFERREKERRRIELMGKVSAEGMRRGDGEGNG